MPHPSQMQDRYGLPLTTSSTRAASVLSRVSTCCWNRISVLRSNLPRLSRPIQGLPWPIVLWRICSIYARRLLRPGSVQKAQALAAGISRRERQQVEAIALFVTGQGPRSMPSFASTWSITHGICCCSEWRSAWVARLQLALGSPVSPRRCSP